jgi:hypothetical protein
MLVPLSIAGLGDSRVYGVSPIVSSNPPRRVSRNTAATLPMWSRKPRLPARSAASRRSRRCRRTLVSTSTSARAASRFYGRAQAIAACSAPMQIRFVRRSRPSPSKTRGSSYPRREGGPSRRARQGCESAQGCTSERRGPRRCAGRCTRAGSRNADPTGCGAVRLPTWRESTPKETSFRSRSASTTLSLAPSASRGSR